MAKFLHYALATFCFAASDRLVLVVAAVTAAIDILSADGATRSGEIAALFGGQLRYAFPSGSYSLRRPGGILGAKHASWE